MNRNFLGLIALFFILASTNSFAQHTLQLDDGHGHYTLVEGQTVDFLDLYHFPPGGGTLLTIPAPGNPALMWLTAANGSLTDLTNNFLGTSDNTPLRIVTGAADAAHTRIFIDVDGTTGINTSTHALTTIGDGSANTQLTINGVADAFSGDSYNPFNLAEWDLNVQGDMAVTGIARFGNSGGGGSIWIDGSSFPNTINSDNWLSLNSGFGPMFLNDANGNNTNLNSNGGGTVTIGNNGNSPASTALNSATISAPNVPSGSSATDVFVSNAGNLETRTAASLIGSTVWLLGGNTGLTDLTNNFLGTTDNTPVYIVTGGTDAAHTRISIGADGTTNINTTTHALTTIGDGSANTQLTINGVADALSGDPYNPLNLAEWDLNVQGDMAVTGIARFGSSNQPTSIWIDGGSPVNTITSDKPFTISTNTGYLNLATAYQSGTNVNIYPDVMTVIQSETGDANGDTRMRMIGSLNGINSGASFDYGVSGSEGDQLGFIESIDNDFGIFLNSDNIPSNTGTFTVYTGDVHTGSPTQLFKVDGSGNGTFAGTVTGNGSPLTNLTPANITPSGTNGDVLTTVGGITTWQAPSGGGTPVAFLYAFNNTFQQVNPYTDGPAFSNVPSAVGFTPDVTNTYFTATNAGTYKIDVSLTPFNANGAFAMLINGAYAPIYQFDVFSGITTNFTTVVTLSAGDIINFHEVGGATQFFTSLNGSVTNTLTIVRIQ